MQSTMQTTMQILIIKLLIITNDKHYDTLVIAVLHHIAAYHNLVYYIAICCMCWLGWRVLSCQRVVLRSGVVHGSALHCSSLC